MLNFIGQESYVRNGRSFDVVFFRDPKSPFMTFFEVLEGGRRVPLDIPGEGLSFVRFDFSDEDAQDALAVGQGSALDALKAEAHRLIEATY